MTKIYSIIVWLVWVAGSYVAAALVHSAARFAWNSRRRLTTR